MLHSATSVVLPLTISRIQTELLTVLLIFREPEEHRTIIISRITITSQPGGTPFRSSYGITPRSIPLCIILSIVTCGIYGIYWMLKLNDEINLLCGDTNATSGALVVIFSLITCGIYGFYWMYKMGEKCDFIKGVQGSSGILYLLLGIFGLSIVDFCLIQDTINKSV